MPQLIFKEENVKKMQLFHPRSPHPHAKRTGFLLLALLSGLAGIYGIGSLMRPSLQSKLVEVALRLIRLKETRNAVGVSHP
jgi:hypothetical protein